MRYINIFLLFSVVGIISVPLRHYITISSDSKIESNLISRSIQKSPPCITMFSCIKKYSSEYNVPFKYALGIAYSETRYEGPFDWDYDHKRISSAGALGPMQIMPVTAKWMWGNKKISREKILSDIDFNVETSMKLLRYLYDKYRDWKIVFGCYNTGSPCINAYAEKVYNFKPNKNDLLFN
jgi:hypothetical protein